MSDEEVVLIRIVDAARLMSISRSRAYSLALRGELPGALRLAGTWRINRRVLESWAAGAANPGTDARFLAEPSATSRSDG